MGERITSQKEDQDMPYYNWDIQYFKDAERMKKHIWLQDTSRSGWISSSPRTSRGTSGIYRWLAMVGKIKGKRTRRFRAGKEKVEEENRSQGRG
jgi:hypothetical protein